MELFSGRGSRNRWRRWADQLSTLGLSVVLGLIVWLIAINQENPVIRDEYPEQIPVTVRGLPDNLGLVQDLSDEAVRVVLQAPKSSWDNLSASDFNAYIDLSGLDAGIYEAPVQVEVVDPQVKLVSVQRPVLRVQIDDIVGKSVPVRAEVMDSAAFGYDWQPPVMNPLTVTVQGPATQVAQVTAAKTELFLRGAKSQVERTQTLEPQNTQGQPVAQVEIIPSSAHFVVPVTAWPGRKEVAVRVSLIGQPASGYRLSSVRVEPSTVVLLGDADVLDAAPGYVETGPLALTNATSEIQTRLELLVPNGVNVLEGNLVDVTATIAPVEGGLTMAQQPVIQGLASGLDADVALDRVDVILSGPLPMLESLGPDDVFVILDLAGRMPGNHIIQPRVVAPAGIQVEGVLPESVEVVITPQATPTPLVVAPPTSTLTVSVTPGVSVTVPVSAPVTLPATVPVTVPATVTATAGAVTPGPTATASAGATAEPAVGSTVTPTIEAQ